MDKRLLFIINLHSGTGKAAKVLGELVRYYTENGWEVTVHPTLSRGDATETVVRMGSRFDMVVCSGGDGTLSETVAGLLQLEQPPVLGFIPAGSANDNAANLHLPADPMEAAKVTLEGEPVPYDVGEFCGKSFIYIAAFGAFSDVSYATPQNLKNALGHAAYMLEGVRSLPRIHPCRMTIETDEETYEGEFLFGGIMNTLSVGGGVMKFDPERVKLNDGYFEVLLLRQASAIALPKMVQSVINRKYDAEGVIYARTRTLKCTSDVPVPWTIDGENGGEHTQVEAHCIHRPITIMAGRL